MVLFMVAGYASGGSAHTPKEGDIWATVGPVGQRTETSMQQSPRLGLAIAAEGDVDYNGGVEIALMAIDKVYVRRSAGSSIAERIKRMYVTTGYRHWLNPYLSGGLAVFSSYSMGDAVVIEDRRLPGSDLATTARAVTEYGADISIQGELWHRDGLAVLADARYSASFSRKAGEQANTYGLMIGLKYLVPKHG